MAKIGVGSAKVDLVLGKPEYLLGEVLEGEFRIKGGSVEQKVNKLDVDLTLRVNANGKEHSQVVAAIPVTSSFIIQSSEDKVIPFTYRLPNNLPLSRGGVSYCLVTRLDIAGGTNNKDQDYVQVVPTVRFNNIIRAMEQLGIREKPTSGKFNGYTQEFEFFTTGDFSDKVKEVEFAAAIDEPGIRLLWTLVATRHFDLGEKKLKREIFLSNEMLDDISVLSNHFKEIMAEMLQNPQAYPASRYHQQNGQGRQGGVLTGAIGGFAAGMFGAMLLEDFIGGDEEEGEEGEEGGFGDFFGGEED
ncbi:MAG: sporulation protein [Thermincolia bacterium]